MLYNFQRKKLCRHLLVGGALCAAGLGIFSCSDRYNLDEDQPSGLDNIYGYMKNKGNFTNYLHLIDDLGQAEILSKTGSKTMFIADDDAFADFYAHNDWGVKKYEDLSLAQKKLLLNTSMIDNPYSTTMLSSAQAPGTGRPAKGEVCRRATSMSLLDSVMVIPTKEADGILPDNPYFNEMRANRDTIVLFTDASNPAPMLHFTGKFVTSNQLSFSDIDFIYNQPEGTFHSDDIYVNNSRVTNANIFCKNGFVHQVDKVVVPLDNMAEIIRKTPQMSIFSSILERFAAPKDSTQLRETYNLANGTDYDSVFVKRYFSDRSWGSSMSRSVAFKYDKNRNSFDGSLKYDPGWNGYIPEIANDRKPMMEDMAVMFVPSDDAIREWWTGGVIEKYYHTIENTPSSVLDDLIRVNQIQSFTSSVPSKFDAVLNDANESMGIRKEDVDHVYLGCNGLVFMTNKVFAPASYSSVLFPAVIDKDQFSVMDNIITPMNYNYYLNSMVSKFVFLLPTNNGLLTFIDPCSYGQPTKKVWEIQLVGKNLDLEARVYDCDVYEDGTIEKKGNSAQIFSGVGNGYFKNRMEDLLDNIIVVEEFDETGKKKFYKTKGRTFVKIEKKGDKNYEVSGSYHYNLKKPLTCVDAYDGEDIRNGITLALDGVVMGTPNSVAKTLHDTEVDGEAIFEKFFGIVDACAISPVNSKNNWRAADQTYGNLYNEKDAGRIGAEDSKTKKATYLLNNYHYTLYAPTNEAMDKAFAAGLPTLDDLNEAELYDEENDLTGTVRSRADSIREVMLDFVKYHIQDNAIFVDVDTTGVFESGKMELTRATDVKENVKEEDLEKYDIVKDKNGNPVMDLNEDGTYNVTYNTDKYTPGRPYKLNVEVNGGQMTVTDCRYGYDGDKFLGGKQTTVLLKEGAYNLMAREYWFTDEDSRKQFANPNTMRLNNSSFVVIHAINDPLIYADGEHYDSKGNKILTQFTYTYKPLIKE